MCGQGVMGCRGTPLNLVSARPKSRKSKKGWGLRVTQRCDEKCTLLVHQFSNNLASVRRWAGCVPVVLGVIFHGETRMFAQVSCVFSNFAAEIMCVLCAGAVQALARKARGCVCPVCTLCTGDSSRDPPRQRLGIGLASRIVHLRVANLK